MRLALSLSALYGIPIEINNIRAGRTKPGLAAQHLKGTFTFFTIIRRRIFKAFMYLLDNIFIL